MERSTIQNKLKDLEISNKVQFNVAMHGIPKGGTVDYKSANSTLKTLIRRRFKDNDDSVEIVGLDTKKKIMEPKSTNTKNNKKKPHDGVAASEQNGDN